MREVISHIDPYKSLPHISTRITNSLIEIEISTVKGFLETTLEFKCCGWLWMYRIRGIGKKSLVDLCIWASGMGYMSKREFEETLTRCFGLRIYLNPIVKSHLKSLK